MWFKCHQNCLLLGILNLSLHPLSFTCSKSVKILSRRLSLEVAYKFGKIRVTSVWKNCAADALKAVILVNVNKFADYLRIKNLTKFVNECWQMSVIRPNTTGFTFIPNPQPIHQRKNFIAKATWIKAFIGEKYIHWAKPLQFRHTLMVRFF